MQGRRQMEVIQQDALGEPGRQCRRTDEASDAQMVRSLHEGPQEALQHIHLIDEAKKGQRTRTVLAPRVGQHDAGAYHLLAQNAG